MTDDDLADLGPPNRYFPRTGWVHITDPRMLTDPPVGDVCMYCDRAIEASDAGVIMPHVDETTTWRAWHIACLRRTMGVGEER